LYRFNGFKQVKFDAYRYRLLKKLPPLHIENLVAMAQLSGEFAAVVSTADLLS